MAQVDPNSRLRGCDWSRACTCTVPVPLRARASKCCTMQRGQAHCKLPRYFVCNCLCVCAQVTGMGRTPRNESFILLPQLFISSSAPSAKHISRTHSFSPTTNAQNPSRKKAKMAKKWWTIRDFKCETGCGTHAQYGVSQMGRSSPP